MPRPGEEHDVAGEHAEVVAEISAIMNSAATPSPRYPVGQIYRGKPLWSPERSGKQ